MSQMAAQIQTHDHNPRAIEEPEDFLPLQLAAAAEATGWLIASGLAARTALSSPSPLTNEAGALRPEIAPLARAYEAALLAGLSPSEVKTLRRLLTRVETAALKLSGRA